MINRILMELYDDYEKDNIDSLTEFANKTFPKDETNIFFVGCLLILFSNCNGHKPRYDATREQLLDIVMSAKEKMNETNLLSFYIDRINKTKRIKKYFDSIDFNKIDKYADLVIDYLNQFKPMFIYKIKNKMDKSN